jgi:hypothetical protein
MDPGMPGRRASIKFIYSRSLRFFGKRMQNNLTGGEKSIRRNFIKTEGGFRYGV